MLEEILHAMAVETARTWPTIILLTASALLVLGFEARVATRLGQRAATFLRWSLAATAVVVGAALAWRVAWLGDDAFISFRYADNFAKGHGLVFNPGEWVEGYTNFLWTLFLGWGGRLGADIPLLALGGNLLSFLLVLLLLASTARALGPSRAVVPFAALAAALSRPMYTFATSGLETMTSTLLVLAGVWACAQRRAPTVLSSAALILASLCRPDLLLLWACMGFAWIGSDLLHRSSTAGWSATGRRAAAYAAPFLGLWVPCLAFRWATYGDPFPNTYYMRAASDPHYVQGIAYLAEFVGTTGAWAWVPVLGIALLGRLRSPSDTRLRLFVGASFLSFLPYVARVGGDFMEHRFLVPLVPIAFLGIEVGLRRILATGDDPAPAHAPSVAERRFALLTAAAVSLAAAALPVRFIEPRALRWNLAAEETFYPIGSISPLRIESPMWTGAQKLRQVFTDRGVRPRLATDCPGMIGYVSDLSLVDARGVITRSIARQPLRSRGRPGHERWASATELIAEGAAISTFNPFGPFGELASATVDDLGFYLLSLDGELVEALAGLPGVRLPDPQRDVEAILAKGDPRLVEEAIRFYSRFLVDPRLRSRLLARLDQGRIH